MGGDGPTSGHAPHHPCLYRVPHRWLDHREPGGDPGRPGAADRLPRVAGDCDRRAAYGSSSVGISLAGCSGLTSRPPRPEPMRTIHEVTGVDRLQCRPPTPVARKWFGAHARAIQGPANYGCLACERQSPIGLLRPLDPEPLFEPLSRPSQASQGGSDSPTGTNLERRLGCSGRRSPARAAAPQSRVCAPARARCALPARARVRWRHTICEATSAAVVAWRATRACASASSSSPRRARATPS